MQINQNYSNPAFKAKLTLKDADKVFSPKESEALTNIAKKIGLDTDLLQAHVGKTISTYEGDDRGGADVYKYIMNVAGVANGEIIDKSLSQKVYNDPKNLPSQFSVLSKYLENLASPELKAKALAKVATLKEKCATLKAEAEALLETSLEARSQSWKKDEERRVLEKELEKAQAEI